MYNIKALEEEWKRYNRKKKRPWFFLIFLIVIVVVASMVLLYIDKIPNLSFLKKNHTEMQKTKEENMPLFVDKALTKLEKKDVTVADDAPMEIEEDVPLPEDPVKTEVPKPKKKLHIEVIDAGSGSASYKEIEKRFRMGHDTDDSLFLAKSYYRKGNYKKAEYWALQTNKVNGNIEESWLIFAKAKVKRGRRNEAIRILNAYIKRTRSAEAKALLEKIKKGKL
jgi:tetratricopeptide (TPR) repeat protein